MPTVLRAWPPHPLLGRDARGLGVGVAVQQGHEAQAGLDSRLQVSEAVTGAFPETCAPCFLCQGAGTMAILSGLPQPPSILRGMQLGV